VFFRLLRQSLGRRGERRAARFLRAAGYRILAHSYVCPIGEIDLVARDPSTNAELGRDTIVFIEVKTRVSSEHGEPWQAVDHRKRRKLTALATYYLKHHQFTDYPARFDIVALTWPPGRFQQPTIEHFPAAFDATGPWSV
jgi:putative endonuclease